MKNLKLIGLLCGVLFLANFAAAQKAFSAGGVTGTADVSPAYIVLASHKAQLAGELENLRAEYTATFPKVVIRQFELEITLREMAKILVMPKAGKAILSESYGKLLVRKITTEASLRDLLDRNTFTSHNVREKSIELQAIENELAKILFE